MSEKLEEKSIPDVKCFFKLIGGVDKFKEVLFKNNPVVELFRGDVDFSIQNLMGVSMGLNYNISGDKVKQVFDYLSFGKGIEYSKGVLRFNKFEGSSEYNVSIHQPVNNQLSDSSIVC